MAEVFINVDTPILKSKVHFLERKNKKQKEKARRRGRRRERMGRDNVFPKKSGLCYEKSSYPLFFTFFS